MYSNEQATMWWWAWPVLLLKSVWDTPVTKVTASEPRCVCVCWILLMACWKKKKTSLFSFPGKSRSLVEKIQALSSSKLIFQVCEVKCRGRFPLNTHTDVFNELSELCAKRTSLRWNQSAQEWTEISLKFTQKMPYFFFFFFNKRQIY